MRAAPLYLLVLFLAVGAIAGIGVYKWWFPCPDPIPCPTATTVDVDSLRRSAVAWELMAQATHERNELLRRELDSLVLARTNVKQLIDNATHYLRGAPVDSLGGILDGAD